MVNAHKIEGSESTRGAVESLFREIHREGLSTVSAVFEDAIPQQFRASLGKHTEIRYDGVRPDKYLVEVALISDELNAAEEWEGREALVRMLDHRERPA